MSLNRRLYAVELEMKAMGYCVTRCMVETLDMQVVGVQSEGLLKGLKEKNGMNYVIKMENV